MLTVKNSCLMKAQCLVCGLNYSQLEFYEFTSVFGEKTWYSSLLGKKEVLEAIGV